MGDEGRFDMAALTVNDKGTVGWRKVSRCSALSPTRAWHTTREERDG